MYKSECLINSLMLELESLISRLKNINQVYSRTFNNNLRERLILENGAIWTRIKEISSIAEFLVERSNDQMSLSNLLLEKSRRTIYQMNIKRNLFFL